MGKIITAYQLAQQVKEVRDLQKQYFASKKQTGYGDKQILMASKSKEYELDQRVQDILDSAKQPGLFE